jgi:hypothetical protein
MPVLTVPRKPAARISLVPASVFRSLIRAFDFARRPLTIPRWAVVLAVAVLAFGGFLLGRQRPAHHYVPYFGYPTVLDTTTGKACYAVPPQPAKAAASDDPAFPLDGTASPLDTQSTAGDQIPLCGQQ